MWVITDFEKWKNLTNVRIWEMTSLRYKRIRKIKRIWVIKKWVIEEI